MCIYIYLYIGSNDEIINVETYILNKCNKIDFDDVTTDANIDIHTKTNDTDINHINNNNSNIIAFKDIIDDGNYYGWHCEGNVIYTLFGLLMYDIIFADIANVFVTNYQSFPLDLNYSDFYFQR